MKIHADELNFQTRIGAGASPIRYRVGELEIRLASSVAYASEWEEKMAKYVCDVCGYVYDEDLGDPDAGIAPGTKFADLPDDFECPTCSVGKDEFSLEE